MLPVKLKMQAFASYADAAEIDFERLDSLFLIHGETGAGKTAILDGMMYALYGESSGGERSEMRCALPKAEGVPTEVEFTFKAGGRLYKFTRSIVITPRSKKLEQRQDCFYYDEKEGCFRAFFENPKQAFVRQKAEELTGLSAEQFRQVIILPQGRFERLLTSGSADKEVILSTLFGAEKYSKLSDRLSEKAEACRKGIAEENAALRAMLAAEDADSPEKLAEERDGLDAEKGQLLPKISEAREGLAEVRKKLTAAEILAAKFAALSEAESQLAEMDGQKARIEEMRKLLAMDGNASKAKPEAATAASAKEAFSVRAGQFEVAKNNVKLAEEGFAEVSAKGKVIAEKEAEFKAKTEELAVLSRLAPVYEKISAAEAAVKNTAAERADLEKSISMTELSLKKLMEEAAGLEVLKNKITQEFSRPLPKLAEKKNALENGAEAEKRLKKFVSALEGIKKSVAVLEKDAENLSDEKAAAEKKYDKLYGEYIFNTAAELSSGLKDGMPCPVCGSLSHPAPADGKALHGEVSAADVKAARAEFEKAADLLAEKLAEKSAQEARIPAAEEYISREREIIAECGYSAAALKDAEERLAEAERQNDRLPEIDGRLGELAVLKNQVEEKIKADGGRLAEMKNAEARAAAEAETLRGQLDGRFPDLVSYNAGVKRLCGETEEFLREKQASEQAMRLAEKRKIETAAALKQAEREYLLAEKNAATAREKFTKKLAELGILSEDDYEKALLDEKTAAEYSAETERYALGHHAVSEQVSLLKNELAGKEMPDVEAAKNAAAEAENLLAELSGREAVIAERLKRLDRVIEEYGARFAAGEKAREQSDKLTAFAKFMHGDRGISFTRYVLSIMLNLVAAEANRILADIHGGRFRLCVKTELAANSKQGLDLEVENLTADSSVKYGVKNLSGGEKFLISLALSLGLSSVARSRSGGIEIEAMFIDEGFGSLDPSSLREAVSILCGLTSRRNTIGIISHVEELKSVIPCGVNVVKDKDGCSKVLSVV